MRQVGKVTSIQDGIAEISVVRETACGESCASCSANCTLKDSSVFAKTISGVRKGDTVIVEMAATKIFFAAFLVYITPLIVLLLGYGVASLSGLGEERSAGIAVAAMIVWFFVVYLIDKKLKKYYKHTIVQVIRGEN